MMTTSRVLLLYKPRSVLTKERGVSEIDPVPRRSVLVGLFKRCFKLAPTAISLSCPLEKCNRGSDVTLAIDARPLDVKIRHLFANSQF